MTYYEMIAFGVVTFTFIGIYILGCFLICINNETPINNDVVPISDNVVIVVNADANITDSDTDCYGVSGRSRE
jgi:hypothetical protein